MKDMIGKAQRVLQTNSWKTEGKLGVKAKLGVGWVS